VHPARRVLARRARHYRRGMSGPACLAAGHQRRPDNPGLASRAYRASRRHRKNRGNPLPGRRDHPDNPVGRRGYPQAPDRLRCQTIQGRPQDYLLAGRPRRKHQNPSVARRPRGNPQTRRRAPDNRHQAGRPSRQVHRDNPQNRRWALDNPARVAPTRPGRRVHQDYPREHRGKPGRVGRHPPPEPRAGRPVRPGRPHRPPALAWARHLRPARPHPARRPLLHPPPAGQAAEPAPPPSFPWARLHPPRRQPCLDCPRRIPTGPRPARLPSRGPTTPCSFSSPCDPRCKTANRSGPCPAHSRSQDKPKPHSQTRCAIMTDPNTFGKPPRPP